MGHDTYVMTVTSIRWSQTLLTKDLQRASRTFTRIADGERLRATDVYSIAQGIEQLIPRCVIGSQATLAEAVTRGFDIESYPNFTIDVAKSVINGASSTLDAMALGSELVPAPTIPAGSRSVRLSVSVLCASVTWTIKDQKMLEDVKEQTLKLL